MANMKKNIITYVSLSVIFFSSGFLANHLLNRVLNKACVDIETYNKMNDFEGDEELSKMHEDFKKNKAKNFEEATKVTSPKI